jgi:hypothetical protein
MKPSLLAITLCSVISMGNIPTDTSFYKNPIVLEQESIRDKSLFLYEQQSQGKSYSHAQFRNQVGQYKKGNELILIYEDAFKYNNHVFGSQVVGKTYDISDKGPSLYSIVLIADNIAILDDNCDGANDLVVLDKNFDLKTKHTGHKVRKQISDHNIFDALNLQNQILDVLVERINTGYVSRETLQKYETAKVDYFGKLFVE